MRDFAVPILLGVVVMAAAWQWDPPPPRLPDDGGAVVRIDTPYVLLPTGGEGPMTLLRYNATPRHDLGPLLDVHGGTAANGTWTWNGTDLVCLRGGDCTAQGHASVPIVDARSAPEGRLGGAGDGARFGHEGLVANVTFFLFADSGHLLASNAPRTAWSGYDLHGDFSPISGRTWWFGAGPTPEGAQAVPAYRTELLDLLWGTPAGGVQSGVLEEHEYDWLLGPVWLTVRVDDVAFSSAGPAPRPT